MPDPWMTTALLASGGCGISSIAAHRLRRARDTARRQLAERSEQLKTAETEAENGKSWLKAVTEEIRHLADKRVPAVLDTVAREFQGVPQPGLLHPQLTNSDIARSHEEILHQFVEGVAAARHRIAGNARMTVCDLIEVPQTLLVSAQYAILAELDRHEDAPDEVIASFRRLDHLITVALRSYQRLRILSGTWPGLQRATSPLGEIIDGAKARIHNWQRINYVYRTETDRLWIDSRYVEPIAVALAELMDNAVKNSTETVSVQVIPGSTSIVVVIEDAGKDMADDELEEANNLLQQNRVLNVTEMTDSLKIGLPVVARILHDYELEAAIDRGSILGGIRAALRIPTTHQGEKPAYTRPVMTNEEAAYGDLAIGRPDRTFGAAVDPRPTSAPAATEPKPQVTPGGLPKRTRHNRRSGPARGPRAARNRTEDSTPLDFADGVRNLSEAIDGASASNHIDNEETPNA